MIFKLLRQQFFYNKIKKRDKDCRNHIADPDFLDFKQVNTNSHNKNPAL